MTSFVLFFIAITVSSIECTNARSGLISSLPSSNPSRKPSSTPSLTPSSKPSLSTESFVPTISLFPSSNPSSFPSEIPSESINPSLFPSTGPSISPSSHPTESEIPSISLNPTISKKPSESPSQNPSVNPTLSIQPTISLVPSSSPSEAPSLNPASTYRTTLAIRVVAPDVSTSASISKLSDKIFGTDFSLKSQYDECSFGKLIFVPFKGITSTGRVISNGVGEVFIKDNANGTHATRLLSVVQNAAEEKYGDLEKQFDNVLFCLPPGALLQGGTDWVGFAFYYHWLSTFNDLYCTYPSALMHEVGHNLGMAHSDEDYGDESCMMGYSYEREDGPRQCFNGAKSWQMGWYEEAHMSINITELSDWDTYEVNLTGVVDFNGKSDQTAIIQIIGASTGLDYYIAFNRKTGFNSGTQEGGDKLLITHREAGQGPADSTLVAQLEGGEDFFIHSKDYKPNVVIHVNSINLDVEPAYASVYISKYHKICYSDEYCNDLDSCTVDTCVPNVADDTITFPEPEKAGKCKFETLPCTECGARVGVRIVTNDYPEHTSWTIHDTNRNMEVMSGGPYTKSNEVYNIHKCLQLGDYKFTINDSKDEELPGSPEYSLIIQGKVTMSNSDPFSFRLLESRSVEKVFVQSKNEDNGFGSYDSRKFGIVCSEAECVDYDACTKDVFDPETRLCIFEPLPTCPNSTKFTVNITTDQYGDETSWNVINLHDKKVILTGGPYVGFGRKKSETAIKRRRLSNNDGTQTHITEMYLEDSLYEFNILDSFGDGMCCDYGNGRFGVSLNDVEVVSGGEFEFDAKTSYDLNTCTEDKDCDDKDECTVDTCKQKTCIYSQMDCRECGKVKVSVHINTDWLPEQISWIVSKGSTGTGDVLMSGNSYSDIQYRYVQSKCLDLGVHTFSIFDSGGNGICCGMGQGHYEITIGDVRLLQGGKFGLLEEKTFNVDITPSQKPSSAPSISPSQLPSKIPSVSMAPTKTAKPSSSLYPSTHPSEVPSHSYLPTVSLLPSLSMNPSHQPSISLYPSILPSQLPSQLPSGSLSPSVGPSMSAFSKCLNIRVKTDHYPGEITWKVVDKVGDVVLKGRPYDERWTSYGTLQCIHQGIYSFVIYDRLGSGSLFDGLYMLSIDNEVIKPPSNFVSSEVTAFTISDTFAPTSSMAPSFNPTEVNLPTTIPSSSISPSLNPTEPPTVSPSLNPTTSLIPSTSPSHKPSYGPSLRTSDLPSKFPSTSPSNSPTSLPSITPTITQLPSISEVPSNLLEPSHAPSVKPSMKPSSKPSVGPSADPSSVRSEIPSSVPSVAPSRRPSYVPSIAPSTSPSYVPSNTPSYSNAPSSRFNIYTCPDLPTHPPTYMPSASPSGLPSFSPSSSPSSDPSSSPSSLPTDTPSASPSTSPSTVPSISFIPSASPSGLPSLSASPSGLPSFSPSSSPSSDPSSSPSSLPTDAPSASPSTSPSTVPSISFLPSVNKSPSDSPSKIPSEKPSSKPSFEPSDKPSSNPSDSTSVTSTYQQSYAGFDSLHTLNETQIAGYEANMAIESVSKNTNMTNIQVTLANQEITSISNINRRLGEQRWTKILTVTFDMTVINDNKDELLTFLENYCSDMKSKDNKIKQFMLDQGIQVDHVFPMNGLSYAPSNAPSLHPSNSPLFSLPPTSVPTTSKPSSSKPKKNKPKKKNKKTKKPTKKKSKTKKPKKKKAKRNEIPKKNKKKKTKQPTNKPNTRLRPRIPR